MLILYIVALLITPTAFCAYPLHDAVKKNRIGDLRTLIAAGANVNEANADGNTPLHIAACWKNIDTTAALTTAGADVNKTDRYGNTPLYNAAYWGNIDVIQVLTEAGADVNTTNQYGITPLHKAAIRRNTSVVKALIAAEPHLDEESLELLRSTMPGLLPFACTHNPATFKFLRQLTRQGEFAPEQLEQIRIQCAGIQRKHMDSLLTDSCSSEPLIQKAKLIAACKQQGARTVIDFLQRRRRGQKS